MEVDILGLNNHDRRILNVIIDKFKGGPVGLQTLAAATSEDEATIEEVYEPFLLQLGFIERTLAVASPPKTPINILGVLKIAFKFFIKMALLI